MERILFLSRTRRVLVAISIVMIMLGSPLPFGPTASAAPSPGAVLSGRIFADYNRDGNPFGHGGAPDAGETVPIGGDWSGFTITATDALGAANTGTIGGDGTYSLPTAGLEGDDFVVELTVPADYQAAPSRVTGADTRPLVWHVTDLVTDRTDQHIGVSPPSTCPSTGTGADGNDNSAGGKLFTTCFIAGDRSLGVDSLVGLNGDNTGGMEHLSSSDELGSVWSVAYDGYHGVLYTGSLLKRHAELGPAGIDGLYWLDYSEGAVPGETVHSADLGASYGTDPDRSGPNTDNVNDALPTAWTEDPVAWDLTGDTGIGDIDLTPDGTRLLVMNLENKSLDVYDVTSIQADPATGAPALLAQWPTPDPGCAPVATGSQTFSAQPFAVTAVDSGTAFVGVTCADASQAVVYAMAIADGTATSHFVLDNAYMSSVRGCNWIRPCAAIPTFGQARWEAWTADWQDLADTAVVAGWDATVNIAIRPAPLLADINVRADGSMDLSMIDRTSLAAGSNQASPDTTTWSDLWITLATGDLVHVCANGAMEGRTGCEITGAEFRVDDWINSVEGFHDEVQVGGAWAPPYGGRLVSTVFDPVNDDGIGDNEWNSGGLHWYGEAEGEELDARIIYQNQAFDGFGKTTGLGDVEGCLLPVAIGNRVWLDVDIDGDQDPTEPGLAGATVTVTGGSLAAPIVVTADADGYWTVDSVDGLLAGEPYTVTIDPTTATNLTPAELAALTETNAGTVGDTLDSDSVSGVAPVAALTPGQTDLSHDSGWFVAAPVTTTTTATTTTTTAPTTSTTGPTPAPTTATTGATTAPTVTVTTTGSTSTVSTPAATASELDLALVKTLAPGQDPTVGVGDAVRWQLSVINQGTVAAGDISLIDYLPAGLGLADTDWSATTSGAVINFGPLTLLPGETATVEITTTVLSVDQDLHNLAEIMSATAVDSSGAPILDGLGQPLVDIDSTPDAVDGDTLVDDATDNRNGDEDDHDVAILTVVQSGTDTGAGPDSGTDSGTANDPDSPPELAFTGPVTDRVAGIGLLLLSIGGFLEILALLSRSRTAAAAIPTPILGDLVAVRLQPRRGRPRSTWRIERLDGASLQRWQSR